MFLTHLISFKLSLLAVYVVKVPDWLLTDIFFFFFLLSAFGFCEYKEPESTLRALRLLHELQIGEKKLLVKVDAKTKAQLDEWKAKKKTASENGVSMILV